MRQAGSENKWEEISGLEKKRGLGEEEKRKEETEESPGASHSASHRVKRKERHIE